MLSKQFQIGDLIRWYTSYADDPDLIRDVGTGLVLNVKEVQHTIPYKLFDVYRFKNSDIISVTERDIEYLKEKK